MIPTYCYPRQKLISKLLQGPKMIKKYDRLPPEPPRRGPRTGVKRHTGIPRWTTTSWRQPT